MSDWTDKYHRCPQCRKRVYKSQYCPRCDYNRPIRVRLYRGLSTLLIFSLLTAPLLFLWKSYWIGYLPTLSDAEEMIIISVLYVLTVSIMTDITVNEP